MKKPTISVIMPVYNGEKFLKPAIRSIINQTFKDFEFIVIEDGSKDKSLNILKNIKDKRLKIIRNKKNLGVAKSLNIGLKVAQGEYIARYDGDDINSKDRFKKQVEFLKKHQDYILVGSNVILIDQKGKIIGRKVYPRINQEIKQGIFIRNPIAHPTVMIRKSTIKKIRGYREIFNGVEDYDLWFRLLKFGKFYNLQENLVQRRIHPDVVTAKSHLKIEFLGIMVRVINISQLFGW